jgi:site-specific DNA-adenine methylase
MKNHFILSYAGNKRQEVEKIRENINLDNIDTIIEPFCGSSALSYYISTLEPLRYKYILNDNNDMLIKLYKIMKNEEDLIKFQLDVNTIAKTLNKEKYLKLDTSLLVNWFIHNKIHAIRASLFPLNYIYKEIILTDKPIINFLRTENIEFLNLNAIEVINKYKMNKKSLIFIDPPYLSLCNDFYKCPSIEIYKWLFDNSINKMKCKIVLCLQDMWIIRLLFKKCQFITYAKKYETSQRTTTHCIIKNNKFS